MVLGGVLRVMVMVMSPSASGMMLPSLGDQWSEGGMVLPKLHGTTHTSDKTALVAWARGRHECGKEPPAAGMR